MEEGIYYLQTNKTKDSKRERENLSKQSENINCVNQKHNSGREMAKDRGKEMEKMTSFYQGRSSLVRKKTNKK